MRRAFVFAAMLALALAPCARADGDPASDVLLSQDVFLPYSQTIPTDLGARIQKGVEAANKAGYKLKVAIIAGRNDLGLVQALWLKPKRYAPFLGQEIRFLYKGTLVVEMPNGFGVFSVSRPVDRERRLLESLVPGPGPKGLAQAMLTALAKLSPVAAKAEKGGGSGSNALDRILIGVGAAVLLAGLALTGRARLHRRAEQEHEDDDGRGAEPERADGGE
jgi:hypothetical protein